MKKRCIVCDPKRVRKIGIVANTLSQLTKNACNKFKVSISGAKILLEDGTEVEDEDYFSLLPNDTVFILTQKTQSNYAFWTVASDLLSKVWKLPLPAPEELQSLIQRLVDDKHTRQNIQALLDKSACNLDDSKASDPCWFQGIPNNVASKEAWMSKNAKERVRGYYTRTKDEMEKLLYNSKLKSGSENIAYLLFQNMFEEMRTELHMNQFYSGYFDRGNQKLRLCNEHGWFTCQGEYNACACNFTHRLNPYGSRESRIIFSTWNLDHVIERSRSIIPALDDAIRNAHNRQINWKYFYKLLFLARGNEAHLQDGNLKLVHIVCHNKAVHANFVCDKSKYYVPHRKN